MNVWACHLYLDFWFYAFYILILSTCSSQGSYREPKVLHVLEFNYFIRVPTLECSWIFTECSEMFLNAFIVRKNLFGPLFIPASDVPASITTSEEKQRSFSVGYHRWRSDRVLKLFFGWNNVLENVQNPPSQKYVLECFWTSSHVFCVNSGFSTEWRDKANCEGVGIGQNVSRSFPFGYYRCWEVNFVHVKWLKLIGKKIHSIIYIYNSVALSVCGCLSGR